MSDTIYRVEHYLKFSADEFIAFIMTSFFAGFVLSFNNWGVDAFDLFAGLQSFMLMFIFILFLLITTVWVCKIVAIRLGYTIIYHAHVPGLIIGLFICVISAGYLPVFLPGGFVINQPERLSLGKYHAYRRSWELGLIAGTFPLIMLLWVLLLNPLYLATQQEIYLQLLVAVCLFAVYACLPLPFVERHHGTIRDWFRNLRGVTFGLEVVYASFSWYLVLCCTVLFFVLVAYLLTILSIGVGIFFYILSLLVGLLGLFVYSIMMKGEMHRHHL